MGGHLTIKQIKINNTIAEYKTRPTQRGRVSSFILWQYGLPYLPHHDLAGVTLVIPARLLNQERGSYFIV